MAQHTIAAKHLGQLLAVISHPARIRIIEELQKGEVDVSTLRGALGISQSGVSQHLAVLRHQGVVSERREGRHVYYKLQSPKLARWLREGLGFVEQRNTSQAKVRREIRDARRDWSGKR